MPSFVESMESNGHLSLDTTVRERLLSVSAATIDRLLAPSRDGASKRRRRRGSSVGRQVPIKTFADWGDAQLGHFEADFVVHSGGSMAGTMVHSLVLTEVASGWTECVPLLHREQSLVIAGLDVLQERLPLGLHGLDTDNDGAFLNETVLAYCRARNIAFTRSRPYRKNDQAWIEQKNGAVVRRYAGYARYEGLDAVKALARLYGAARLYVNYFMPSFKLKRKTRTGAKVEKDYYPPETPCNRLLAHDKVPSEVKERLRSVRSGLDPVELLGTIREAQRALLELGEAIPTSETDQNADDVLAAVAQLWRDRTPVGRRRATTTPRTWRTRADPFADVWPDVLSWLAVEPELTAKLALDRLFEEHPGAFKPGQLRTLQRRFQEWRFERALSLIGTTEKEVA